MRKLTKEEMKAVSGGGNCYYVGDNYNGYWVCPPPPPPPPPPYCPYNNC